jgi:hypothetical protein
VDVREYHDELNNVFFFQAVHYFCKAAVCVGPISVVPLCSFYLWMDFQMKIRNKKTMASKCFNSSNKKNIIVISFFLKKFRRIWPNL